jgi:hypothetical protein
VIPKEARKLWTAALRSGRYEQGHLYLSIDGKFCCLGVACELYLEQHRDQMDVYSVSVRYYDGEYRRLPSSVQSWLGLTGFEGQHNQGSLSKMNDTGSTFAQIADFIDSEPAGLLSGDV